eukprot:TRINITY_DN8493_c0_g1_i1.p1 TRINITY_DN8493_c0_g1~~TRINITY_DN8493_c0_g1_i1.p1  ORF type:complete len:483 (+),score=108.76 TRINITY_DN8493_c0_g1_i1:31-1479(+)
MTEQIIVQRGNIAFGYRSIAEYLGFDPSQTVFINTLVTNPQDPEDYKLATFQPNLDWCSAQYSPALTESGSSSVTFKISDIHSEYLQKYVVKGTLLSIPAQGYNYPGGSLIHHLIEVIDHNKNEALLKQIEGKRTFNSYHTNELDNLLKKLGHCSMVATKDYLRFISKTYVREISPQISLSVPPGIILSEPDTVDSYYKMLQALCKDGPLKKIWIKAASLAGGDGIIPLKNPDKTSISAALKRIANGYKEMGFFKKDVNLMSSDENKPFDGIDYFAPIIVDIDIESLPDIDKVILNTCVQGVVSKEKVTLVGTTIQRTLDGEYLDGYVPFNRDTPDLVVAEKEALKLMKKLSEDGYVGYAGVDVLVAKSHSNELIPYVLEVNTRLNGSTPLLSLVQRAEERSGQKYLGLTTKLKVAKTDGEDLAKKVMERIGENLYKAEETDYEGILPFVLDSTQPHQTSAFVVILAKTSEKLEQLAHLVRS